MAHVVVLGAGLGGTIMAYEMSDKLGKEHQVSVVNNGGSYSFVPSNPWVAVGWRDREAVEVDLAPVLRDARHRAPPAGREARPSRRRTGSSSTTAARSTTTIWSSPPAPTSPSTRSRASGPRPTPSRSATSTTRCKAKTAFDALVAKPGPVVIGAVQGASCFGPAYEFAFILDTALRDAKVRDRVPMTFVTSEPYIGHLGLDGVGDTKGLLESALREHHIKWITNAKVDKVEPGKMFVEEIAEDGSRQAGPRAALRLLDDAAGLPRRRGGARHRGADQPARLHPGRQAPAQPGLPERLRGRRLRRDPAGRQDAGAGRRAEDRLHDRIDGDRDRREHRAR